MQHLVNHWPDASAAWSFLIAQPGGRTEGSERQTGAPVATLAAGAAEFARQLEAAASSTIHLHYVSFGYDANGCPEWLVDGLERWKRAAGGRQLFVFFHELSTMVPPWKRMFWSQPRQRAIIQRLTAAADACATNCPAFLRRLIRDFGADPTRLMMTPVGPNLEAPDGFERRRTGPPKPPYHLLIFGLPGSRHRTLHAHRHLLRILNERGQLGSVHLAGHLAGVRDTQTAQKVIGRGSTVLQTHPDLDAEAFAHLANAVDFSLLWYWPEILGKSSVFAVNSVFGIPSIIVERGPRESGFLTEPNCYVCPRSGTGLRRFIERLSDAAALVEVTRCLGQLTKDTLSWPAIAVRLFLHFR